jgi:maltose/maltodextrin transport system substrate-binding protein
MRLGILLLPLCFTAALAPASAQSLHDQAVAESLTPVRPGVPARSPFWNANAKQFVYAPAFEFKTVPGANAYRFTVTGADGRERTFDAAEPWAPLSPVWADVPVGTTNVRVEGVDGEKVIGLAGERTFHRGAVFGGEYGNPVLPYAQSARVALATVVAEPFVKRWRETGKPDADYALYRYPSKIIGKVMTACATYALQDPLPADAAEALDAGRRAADYLMSITTADGPLAGMPPTYERSGATGRENDRWTWMMTPAEAGQGYLDLYDATKDEKYLQAAGRIAAGYARLQRPDGTWNAKVDNQTNEALSPTDLIPAEVIDFLDRVAGNYPNAPGADQAAAVRDRAVAWTRANPLRTFNWQAQFDDMQVRGPYQNLAKHEACMFAAYLFRTGSKEDLAAAEELLTYAEDQFVVWGAPPASSAKYAKADDWYTPASTEQYAMFEPVSGSSAFMIMAYIAAYRATHKPLHLAKAQALADTLTRAQARYNGRYPTRLYKSRDRTYWVNSTVNVIRAMRMLASALPAGEKK